MNEKEIKKIKKIKELVNNAYNEYVNLNVNLQKEIADFHTEKFSLPYCLRWSLNACNDLLEEED